LIEPEDPQLSIRAQCALVGLPRATFYYTPIAESEENLALMRRIDELYLQHPFFGSRKMAWWLSQEGAAVNRKRVQRLMRLMGLEAIYPGPKTTVLGINHRIYPYLLRGVRVERVNQVWGIDITYVPMAQGFLYLVAVMDWHSRMVLAWRLSNSLEVEFCLEALAEALGKGKPEIFNSDQGAQFTSLEFVGRLEEAQVAISMDGKGRCLDNVFVERLWRSVKYEEIYLRAYGDGKEAQESLERYFRFYCWERPHQGLGYRTPAEVYEEGVKGKGESVKKGYKTVKR
jgi:putative transposase